MNLRMRKFFWHPPFAGGLGAGLETILIASGGLSSAIFLAWSANLCLNPQVFLPLPRQSQTYSIDISGTSRGSAGGPNAVTIEHLLIDGRRARRTDLRLLGEWKLVEPFGKLKHPNSLEPATVSFSARSVNLLLDRHDRCGNVAIRDESVIVWRDSCAKYPSNTEFVDVDLPSASAQTLPSFVVWMTVSLLALVAVRPWAGERRMVSWLLIYLLASQFLSWATLCVGTDSDSTAQMTNLILNIRGYPQYYPPGYPLLVGIGYWLSSTNAGTVITLLQHLMMIGVIWWCFSLLRRYTPAWLAFLAVLLTGATAPVLFLPQSIMSENLALFGMAGALYFAIQYREHSQLHAGIVSGLLFGWAVAARVVPLTAGSPAIFAIMLGVKPVALAVKRYAVIIATAALVLALPITWFGVKSGSFSLTSSVGHHMYDRVVDDQELLDPAAPGTSRFLQLVAPVNPKGMAHWEIGHVLAKKGLDWSATESLMKEVSWEGVRHAPLRFVGFSFHQAWNELFADPTGYILWWAVPDEYSKELETVPALGVRESSLKWRGIVDSQFRAMWNVIPWLALASLLSLPFMQDKLVFLGVAILSFFYLLSTAFVEYFLPRYNLAIIPFVFLMAIGLFTGIPKLAYEIRRAVRRRWIHPEERRSTARIYR